MTYGTPGTPVKKPPYTMWLIIAIVAQLLATIAFIVILVASPGTNFDDEDAVMSDNTQTESFGEPTPDMDSTTPEERQVIFVDYAHTIPGYESAEDAELVVVGNLVCKALESGQTKEGFMKAIESQGNPQEQVEASISLTNAAVTYLCPQHA